MIDTTNAQFASLAQKENKDKLSEERRAELAEWAKHSDHFYKHYAPEQL